MKPRHLASIATVLVMLVGCGTQPSPPVQPASPTQVSSFAEPSCLTLAEAKGVLVSYSRAKSDEEALQFLTGKEREYLELVIADRKAGRPHTAFPWRASRKSEVTIVECASSTAIVELKYINSFSLAEESMRFRLEKSDGGWLVSNHTNAKGVWWPDYLYLHLKK